MLHGTVEAEHQFGFAPANAQDMQGLGPAGGTAAVVVPDAHLLFNADFKRVGTDLILTGEDGHTFSVHDYFRAEMRPLLLSPEGAALGSEVIEALTGHGKYAQAGAAGSGAQQIGRVASVTGSVTAIRNGVAVTLNSGDTVLKGDVIQTASGSTVGITFLDGATFNLTANARMVLNEFVYDPNGSQNSMLVNLVQGSLTFISGEVAHSGGDMRVGTPVATMGIRGTQGQVVDAQDGTVSFSIMDQDGTHQAVLIDNSTGAVLGTVSNQGGILVVRPVGPLQVVAEEIGKTPQQLALELNAVQQLLNTQSIGQQLIQQPNTPNDTNPKSNSDHHGSTTPFDILDSNGHVVETASLTIIPPSTDNQNPPNPPPSNGDNNTNQQNGQSSAPASTNVTSSSNPAPFFVDSGSSHNTGSVVDDSGKQILTTTGNLAFTDVNDTHAVGAVAESAASTDGHVLGTLQVAITNDTSGSNTDGQISWTYTIDESVAVHLGEGQTHTDVFAVNVTDSGGKTAIEEVSVTIIGVNDAPVITATTATANYASLESQGSVPSDHLINGLGGSAGYGENALSHGDDNSSAAIDITSVFGPQGLDFFGHEYTQIYINNNGNITFGGPSSAYTPSVISAGVNNPIIAPFWADVDTRGTGNVYYDLDAVHGIVTITWDQVGYYNEQTNKLDSFQLQLIGTGDGNFDIVFRYDDITWTTGDASGGNNGLGGSPARAGYSAGDGVHYFELPGSGNQNDMLDLSGTADIFHVQDGNVLHSIASGDIQFSDPDTSDTHIATVAPEKGGDGYVGLFTLIDPSGNGSHVSEAGGSGSVDWNFDISDSALQNIGAPITQTYDVNIADNHNGVAIQAVSITIGGSEHDNFVFNPGMGTDVIVNFNANVNDQNHDTIDLTEFNIASLSNLSITQNSNGDAVIALGHGDGITVAGVTAADLNQHAAQLIQLHQTTNVA